MSTSLPFFNVFNLKGREGKGTEEEKGWKGGKEREERERERRREGEGGREGKREGGKERENINPLFSLCTHWLILIYTHNLDVSGQH